MGLDAFPPILWRRRPFLDFQLVFPFRSPMALNWQRETTRGISRIFGLIACSARSHPDSVPNEFDGGAAWSTNRLRLNESQIRLDFSVRNDFCSWNEFVCQSWISWSVIHRQKLRIQKFQSDEPGFTGSVISASCDALRHRIYDISFNKWNS